MSHENDDRFHKTGVAAPLTFLVLFVIFVYGALIVGLLGVSSWIIHDWQLEFFLERGNWGVVLMVLCILGIWIGCTLTMAALPYFILRLCRRPLLASKIATIILLLFFHVFAMPWILWPVIRRASPKWREKHLQKLKKMAKGPEMQRRLAERRTRLVASKNA